MQNFRFLALGAAILVGSLGSSARASSVEMSGAVPHFKDVQINSRNVYDYTFTTAPVDWRIASGVWEMTNRWSCSPGWSWFGGRSDEVASIWNKRVLGGDMSAQMYFAFKMGLSGAWPEYPADAAMTILGDGKNLSSGYTFIAGADDNTRSILLKNGKIVAQSSAKNAILPRLTDGNPGNDAMHRRWWFLKMERVGKTVKCYLDGELVVSYDDAQPIPSGQTAIWTYNNGLMLARVQLYFERENRRALTAKTPVSVPKTSRLTTKAAAQAKGNL